MSITHAQFTEWLYSRERSCQNTVESLRRDVIEAATQGRDSSLIEMSGRVVHYGERARVYGELAKIATDNQPGDFLRAITEGLLGMDHHVYGDGADSIKSARREVYGAAWHQFRRVTVSH